MRDNKTSRASQSDAWAEGLKAGRLGKPRASNPYIGKDGVLAKNWDQGWKEGAEGS